MIVIGLLTGAHAGNLSEEETRPLADLLRDGKGYEFYETRRFPHLTELDGPKTTEEHVPFPHLGRAEDGQADAERNY